MLPSGSVKFRLHGSVGDSKKTSDSLFPGPLIDLSDSTPVSPWPHNPLTIYVLPDTAHLGRQPSVARGEDRQDTSGKIWLFLTHERLCYPRWWDEKRCAAYKMNTGNVDYLMLNVLALKDGCVHFGEMYPQFWISIRAKVIWMRLLFISEGPLNVICESQRKYKHAYLLSARWWWWWLRFWTS